MIARIVLKGTKTVCISELIVVFIIYSRCGNGTKEFFFSPCMQHLMCGIPMMELNQDRDIYKVGAPQKVYFIVLVKHFMTTLYF